MKEVKVVRLKHPDYLSTAVIEREINKVFQRCENWEFKSFQFVPIPVEAGKLTSPTVGFGFLFILFEQEVGATYVDFGTDRVLMQEMIKLKTEIDSNPEIQKYIQNNGFSA